MEITYVMMQYPLPTQTFAISDIATLRSLGHKVTVECLLPARPEQRRLCETYQLDRSDIRNTTFAEYLSGIPLVLKYLIQNPSFFFSLLKRIGLQPKRIVIVLVLLPRMLALVEKLSRHPVDVVHAFWGHWPSIVPALLKRYAPDTRTSIHMGAYDLYAGFPLGMTAEIVDDCFTHSTSNLPRIAASGVAKRIHVIHRGIPLDDLLSADAKGEVIERKPAQFCTASALTEAKRVDLCIQIFAQVKQHLPKATLIVVGDGAERRRLESLASDLGVASSVTFAGYKKRHDLFRIMCASEVFLFSSQKVSERLPNVIKEAMFAKCVCFVSNTQGITELIPGSEYGFVFEAEEWATIPPKVLATVEDAALLRRIGENAQSYVIDHFSSQSAMKKYVDIWTAPTNDGVHHG